MKSLDLIGGEYPKFCKKITKNLYKFISDKNVSYIWDLNKIAWDNLNSVKKNSVLLEVENKDKDGDDSNSQNNKLKSSNKSIKSDFTAKPEKIFELKNLEDFVNMNKIAGCEEDEEIVVVSQI